MTIVGMTYVRPNVSKPGSEKWNPNWKGYMTLVVEECLIPDICTLHEQDGGDSCLGCREKVSRMQVSLMLGSHGITPVIHPSKYASNHRIKSKLSNEEYQIFKEFVEKFRIRIVDIIHTQGEVSKYYKFTHTVVLGAETTSPKPVLYVQPEGTHLDLDLYESYVEVAPGFSADPEESFRE